MNTSQPRLPNGPRRRNDKVIVKVGTMTKSCRYCGASVVWGVDEATGDSIPADAIRYQGEWWSHLEVSPDSR